MSFGRQVSRRERPIMLRAAMSAVDRWHGLAGDGLGHREEQRRRHGSGDDRAVTRRERPSRDHRRRHSIGRRQQDLVRSI
jgi:hypothetical protein